MFLVSIVLLTGTAFSAPTISIDLDAKVYPISGGPGGPLGHFRTYYKPGDHIMLDASHSPGYKWGISWNDGWKDAIYVFTVTNNNRNERINDPPPFERPVSLHASNSGFGIPLTIPTTAKSGDSYTLTVTLSVSGLKIKPINPKYASTIIRVTDEISTDLWIPFMGEFDQGDWIWGTDHLGTCTTTMAENGCATTAKAFLFSYLDYNNSWNYQPGILNQCLTLQGAYGHLKGDPPNELCGVRADTEAIALKCAPFDVIWDGYYTDNLKNRINNQLADGWPVLIKAMQEYNPKHLHYYVVVGKRGTNKWNVFDPLDGQIYRMEDTRLQLNNSKILAVYLYSQPWCPVYALVGQ